MMLYKTLLVAALASLVAAQNAFTMDGPSSITAGTPYNITWAPSAGSKTVSLFLRQGEPKSLTTVATIASSIQNIGSYLWTPPSTLPAGTNYAFEIVDGSDPNINDYSTQFAIDSTNTATPDATSQSIHTATVVVVPTSASSLTDAKKETSTSSSVATTDSTASVKSESSTAVKSKDASTSTGKETSSASKKPEATKTGTSTATATDSATSSKATKNAAGAVRASGALLGLGVVGGLMAAL